MLNNFVEMGNYSVIHFQFDEVVSPRMKEIDLIVRNSFRFKVLTWYKIIVG